MLMTNCFFFKSTHAIITLRKSVKLHYQHDMMTYNPIVNATKELRYTGEASLLISKFFDATEYKFISAS